MPKSRAKTIFFKDEKGHEVGWHDLSAAEGRLLEALHAHDIASCSITEICKRASVSRMSYYAMFRREAFRRAVKEVAGNMVFEALVPVTHRLRQKALEFKDHHPARLVLEMAGMLQPSSVAATQINLSLGFARPKFEDKEKVTSGFKAELSAPSNAEALPRE